jgi:glucose-6-phosphate-specific signal transduction histidine kinase
VLSIITVSFSRFWGWEGTAARVSRVDTVLLVLSVQSRRFLESSFLLTFYESLNVTGVEEGID